MLFYFKAHWGVAPNPTHFLLMSVFYFSIREFALAQLS